MVSCQERGKNGKPRIRWGYEGNFAESEVRSSHLNKSIKKALGPDNPIRYSNESKHSLKLVADELEYSHDLHIPIM